jgi:hypothetical protein
VDGKGQTIFPPYKLLWAALAALVFAFAGPAAPAETGASIMIAIDRMELGSPPSGFTFARTGKGSQAEWRVAADPTADGGRAIEQTSTDRTGYRFPLAIHDSLSATNLNVGLRFKAVAGKVDQAGGIAVRLADPDNYYVARANALENNVRFYRVVKGQRQQLGGTNLKVTAGEWHTLGLRAEHNRFTVSYDGQTLFSVTDDTLTAAGGVALWTKADSITRFDRINIVVLP